MLSDVYREWHIAILTAVYAGVEELDAFAPGWEEDVNVDILTMHDVEFCLLSQLFGGYVEGLRMLGIDNEEEGGDKYGFDISPDVYDVAVQEELYDMLVHEWTMIIQDRTELDF